VKPIIEARWPGAWDESLADERWAKRKSDPDTEARLANPYRADPV